MMPLYQSLAKDYGKQQHSIWLTTRMATVQIGRVYPISWTDVSNELDKLV